MKRCGVWSLRRSSSRVGGCVGREVYCWGRGGGAECQRVLLCVCLRMVRAKLRGALCSGGRLGLPRVGECVGTVIETRACRLRSSS